MGKVALKRRYLKPWIFGIAAGSLVVLAEAFAGVYPPAAYSFCLTCHTRDLVNTLINLGFNANYQTALIAHRVLMVTSPSVFFGALLAAGIFREYRKQRSSHPIAFFISGFMIMTVGILVFGCPTRMAIRSGYGDLFGIIGFFGIAAGIYCATHILRRIWRYST
jgi:hypothetical protein